MYLSLCALIYSSENFSKLFLVGMKSRGFNFILLKLKLSIHDGYILSFIEAAPKREAVVPPVSFT